MNLKYYLRGLGIGIVVAAILMGVATSGNDTMTDAEIKERAAQLGMVEQKVLADISNTGSETPKATSETTKKPQESTAETQETDIEETLSQENKTEISKSDEEGTQESQAPTGEEDSEIRDFEATDGPTPENITLTIQSGESSWSVSKTLAEYGLVEDAAAFDRYLSQGGYDKSICIGEFEIRMGATYEEIAKIITKRD